MKYEFAFCILAAAFVVCLHAVPLRTQLHELFPATSLEKGLGDIWTNCSKSSDEAQIISVMITPDPPKKGAAVTVKAEFMLKEEVTGGKVVIKAKWDIIPLPTITEDLCDLGKAYLPCPVAAGTHTVTITETIPGVVPGGHYTGNAVATDQNGKELACVNFDTRL